MVQHSWQPFAGSMRQHAGPGSIIADPLQSYAGSVQHDAASNYSDESASNK